jgi:SNF2 family DNA or RNA helicase
VLVRLEKGRLVLDVDYFQKDRVKQVPGMTFRDGRWSAPATWGTALALRGVFGDELALDDDVVKWGWEIRQEVAQRADAKERTNAFPFDARLFDYQQIGAWWLAVCGQACLADDMGVGKTIQAIAAAGILHDLGEQDPYPILVIAPNTTLYKWQKAWADWGGLEASVVTGTAVQRRKAIADETAVKIIAWDNLKEHSRLSGYGSIALTPKETMPKELNRPWGLVIADEAHRAKDPKAKWTRALWAIGETAHYRFALTGTPLANSPEDTWSIMHWVDPDSWASRSRYIDRYCEAGLNYWGGFNVFGLKKFTAEEFHALLNDRMLRRTKAEVLPWLPPKLYETRPVEMPTKQSRAYRDLEGRMLAEVDGGILAALSPLALATRLSQAAAATPTVDEVLDVVGLAAPSCKVEALLDILAERAGRSTVVFACSKKLLYLCSEALTKAGLGHELLTGDQGTWVRQQIIEKFQGLVTPTILVQIQAGGEGIDLWQADCAVFLQRSYSMVYNAQAEDRLHRIGAEKHERILIVDVITQDTIESDVHEAWHRKEDLLEEVVRDRLRGNA